MSKDHIKLLFSIFLIFMSSYALRVLLPIEIHLLERYNLVFYYILNPDETDAPIGNPIKELFILILMSIHFASIAWAGFKLKVISLRCIPYIVILTILLLFFRDGDIGFLKIN